MIIANWKGEWIEFDESNWYLRQMFRVVISEAGMMMRRSNEKDNDTTGGTTVSGVLPAGQVYSVDPGI